MFGNNPLPKEEKSLSPCRAGSALHPYARRRTGLLYIFTLPFLCSLYFAGTKARSAHIHLLCTTVYLNSYRFHVRFPNLITSSMRVADSVTKVYALSTNCTFSHEKHLLLLRLRMSLYS